MSSGHKAVSPNGRHRGLWLLLKRVNERAKEKSKRKENETVKPPWQSELGHHVPGGTKASSVH